MEIKPLGLRSELFFWERVSEVHEKDGIDAYIPKPDAHWWTSNVLVARRPPEASDVVALAERCERLLSRYGRSKGYLLFWNEGELSTSGLEAYHALGFQHDTADVLKLGELREPRYANEKLEVTEVGPQDPRWAEIVMLNVEGFEPQDDGRYARLSRYRFADYRKLIAEGKGSWFAATLDGRLAGAFGIFYGDDFARYQQVVVRPEFRGQGIASAMLYHGAAATRRALPQHAQILIADSGEALQRVYHGLGFEQDSVQQAIVGRKLQRRPFTPPNSPLFTK